MPVKIGKMEGAGPYYGMVLDELDGALSWTPEEEALIERCCNKILENVQEEEMTPYERWKATIEGRERDRLFVETTFFPLYAIRTLDSFGNVFKPNDAYRFPKLNILAQLATVATFKHDSLVFSAINYAENMFGWDCKMIEYGNPVTVGDPPIKSIEDLDDLELGDPMRHGLYPQYLWSGREIKRIFKKYGLDGVLPFNMSTCAESIMTAALCMMGQAQFMVATRKNPELCKRAVALATEWCIKYHTQTVEVCDPDVMFMCGFYGCSPYKGNEWMAEENAKIGKALGPLRPATWGWALSGVLDRWLDAQVELGAVGPDGFIGMMASGDIEFAPFIDFLVDNDLCGQNAPSDKLVLSGPLSAVEDEIKYRCDYIKDKGRKTKVILGVGSVDYWTPHEHFSAAIEMSKQHGRF